MSKPDGGPAFPRRTLVSGTYKEDGEFVPIYYDSPGITLRDYFAAKALACVPEMWKGKAHVSAKWAYDVADAMLEERKI